MAPIPCELRTDSPTEHENLLDDGMRPRQDLLTNTRRPCAGWGASFSFGLLRTINNEGLLRYLLMVTESKISC